MAKLGRPRIEPTLEMVERLNAIKAITEEIHQTQEILMKLARTRRMLVNNAKADGATHRAIYEFGGAYVRNPKVEE